MGKICKNCKEEFKGTPTQEICDSCIQKQVDLLDKNYKSPFERD